MARTRTPRVAGDLRRKENLHYLEFMVELAMPEGIARAELLPRYAYDTGLTVKKANEHLDLLIENHRVTEDDMRIYYIPTIREQGIRAEAERDSKLASRRALP